MRAGGESEREKQIGEATLDVRGCVYKRGKEERREGGEKDE